MLDGGVVELLDVRPLSAAALGDTLDERLRLLERPRVVVFAPPAVGARRVRALAPRRLPPALHRRLPGVILRVAVMATLPLLPRRGRVRLRRPPSALSESPRPRFTLDPDGHPPFRAPAPANDGRRRLLGGAPAADDAARHTHLLLRIAHAEEPSIVGPRAGGGERRAVLSVAAALAVSEWKSPASSDASLPPYELISARRRSSHCLLLLDVSLPNTLWYCRRSAVMDASEVSVACQLSLRHGSSSYPPYRAVVPAKGILRREHRAAHHHRPLLRIGGSVVHLVRARTPQRGGHGQGNLTVFADDANRPVILQRAVGRVVAEELLLVVLADEVQAVVGTEGVCACWERRRGRSDRVSDARVGEVRKTATATRKLWRKIDPLWR